MSYTAANAISAMKVYVPALFEGAEIIPDTKGRGYVVQLGKEKAVVFVYPIVHKQDDSKNYFDTRDSGRVERAIAWNYSIKNGLKYFCLGIQSEVEKYKDYVFSLECSEQTIQRLSGTDDSGRSQSSSGNQIIIPNPFVPNMEFERIKNQLGTYIAAIHKDGLLDYLEKYDNRPYSFDEVIVPPAENSETGEASDFEEESENESEIEIHRVKGNGNILLYGVPGAGKSYTIASEYCRGVKEDQIQRVVFHPDYSYSDFVGQILPKVTKNGESSDVSYEFVPGPFTNILSNAYKYPLTKWVLIIEELNRGNAPAIFGEMFQLLDRKIERKTIGDNGLQIGSSEYGVTNREVALQVYGDENHKVYLPSNLEIFATMNTSDQNVFTLDTAFQRRWQMRLLENTFDTVKDSLASARILDTGLNWEKFCTSVNTMIINSQADIASSEDKRLGVYFVAASDLKVQNIALTKDESGNEIPLKNEYKGLLKKKANGELPNDCEKRLEEISEAMKQNRRFAEKVLKYLWDDAFKFNRDEFFKKEMDSLEKVVSNFIFEKEDSRWKSILCEKAILALGLNK